MVEEKRSTEEARVLMVFLIELREQCSQCIAAFHELEEVVKNPPPEDMEGRRDWNRRIWLRVHALLSSSSNVSHILWPNPDRKRGVVGKQRSLERGKELRKFLGIQGENPLIARRVRNAFEHVDEKLDDWLPTIFELIPLGWSVSSMPKEKEPKEVELAFRYLNVNTMDLRIVGNVCNIVEIVGWIDEIRQRIPHEAQMYYTEHGKRPPA